MIVTHFLLLWPVVQGGGEVQGGSEGCRGGQRGEGCKYSRSRRSSNWKRSKGGGS